MKSITNSRPRQKKQPLAIAFLLLAAISGTVRGDEIPERVPVHRSERLLVATEPSRSDNYLCFPSVLDLGEEILVSYKRGHRHGGDDEAGLELLRIDGATRTSSQPEPLARMTGRIMQMGEWVRFPNGDVANYIDAQILDENRRNQRIGMVSVRSEDGGRTFGPPERVGTVGGVEYGYPFSFLVEGRTAWMLVMGFSNLVGGYSIHPPRPHAGPVCVIRSDDDGRSWHFVRNLTREFGDPPINESFFARHLDGFLVVTRGYDNRARLHLTDGDFAVEKQIDLTEACPFIRSYIGRPRLFQRDGGCYLVGRNWTEDAATPSAMKMCLFRIDPEAMAVVSYSVLDNSEGANVTDGYYPAPYFREKGGEDYLYLVDYKAMDKQPPQIVEFEYRWEEIR